MPPSSAERPSSGLALIAAAACLWGAIPLLAREAGALSPWVIAFWRVTFAAGAFLIYLGGTGRLAELRTHGRGTVAALAGLGVTLAAIWLLFFSALGQARVAVAVVLTFTWPLFAALLAPLLAGDPFDKRILPPLGIALSGVVVIALSGGGDGSPAPGSELLGALLALACALLIGSATSVQRRLLRGTKPSAELMMFVQTAVASLVLLPGALVLPGPTKPGEWSALVALGLFMTTIPFVLYLRGLYRSRADQVGVVAFAEPVSAALLASLFLGEALTLPIVLGGVAVLTGGLLTLRLGPPGHAGPGVGLEG